MSEKYTHVIDSNVLIHSAGMEIPFDNMVTVPDVTAEMESFRARRRFEAEDIGILEPSSESLEEVKARAKEGQESLSETDMKLVALAMELDAFLVTDDYGMQNLAEKLGVECKTFLKEGIEETKDWKTVCSGCGKEVEGKKCPVCGSGTERKSKS